MRFDATLKDLIECYPGDLPRFVLKCLGMTRPGPISLINVDLSTVTAAADKVIRVGGRHPWLFNLELLAGHDARVAQKLLTYNALLGYRYDLPVRSTLLLLSPQADRGSLTGELHQERPGGGDGLVFRYDVLRLWQLPLEPLLTGGVGLLPLAPLANVPEDHIPGLIARIEERIASEVPPEDIGEFWTRIHVLLGVRLEPALAEQLTERVRSMQESSTYRAIMAKGAARELQKVLLILGEQRFGVPAATTRAALESINDLAILEEMSLRILSAATWDELLPPAPATTPTRRPRRRA